MFFKSKKTSLVILGITSLVCSRVMFALFNDPEGPNLLIVVVAAAVIYFLSLAIYLSKSFPSFAGIKRLLLAILTQIIIVSVFYFLLR